MSRRKAGGWARAVVILVIALAGPAAGGPHPTPRKFPPFEEMFLYGLVIFDGGQARLQAEPEKPATRALQAGEVIAVGSRVTTPGPGNAQLRLGCGSIIRLAPGSSLRVRPRGIDLEKGDLLVRHVGHPFPIKVGGAATYLVSTDSVSELARQEDRVLGRVQAGRMQVYGLPGHLAPGQTVAATGRTAQITEEPFPTSSWTDPVHDLGIAVLPPVGLEDLDILGGEEEPESVENGPSDAENDPPGSGSDQPTATNGPSGAPVPVPPDEGAIGILDELTGR